MARRNIGEVGVQEDELLDRIAVEQVLAKLSPADRTMMLMIFGIAFPDDWGNRPTTFTSIGEYIGLKYEGVVLKEATIRYRRDVILKILRGERGGLRRSRRAKGKK